MILIDTKTLALHVRDYSDPPPRYAILSHVWGRAKDEVTYEEMLALPEDRTTTTKDKRGYRKLVETCKLASSTKYDLPFAWVDTCCINKASSADLSEAINSMYRYYEEAATCFAYLFDVTDMDRSFRQSKWFTRGWTLQELIAPKEVDFFDQKWELLGSKSTQKTATLISEITGIPREVLDHSVDLVDVPIAQRFSWASERETTRKEDEAYSLLGIFDINMAMLYGEGKKAFIRLQEQILGQSADDSIFLWSEPFANQKFSGLLASSPHCFRQMRSIKAEPTFRARDFYLTNRGIRLQVGLAWDERTGMAILPIKHSIGDVLKPVGIYLRRVGPDSFVRARPGDWAATVSRDVKWTDFTVVKSLTDTQSATIINKAMRIVIPQEVEVTQVEPRGLWDPSSSCLNATHAGAILGFVEFKRMEKEEHRRFAFIFFFRNGHWQATIAAGTEWDPIRKNFYPHYKHYLHELRINDTMGDARMRYLRGQDKMDITIHMRINKATGRPYLDIKVIKRPGAH
jgi:hypothetical protein